MTDARAAAALARAVEVSREMLDAADAGLAERVLALDAERCTLLASVRAAGAALDAPRRALIEEIRALNDRTLGSMEHGMRRVARELDAVSTGRRAIAAYAGARG